MRRFLPPVLLLALLAACGEDTPQDQLTGTWSGDLGGTKLVLVLAEDGKLTMQNGEQLLGEGTWSVADGKLMLDVTRAGGGKETLTCDYTLKDDVLRLAGEAKDCAQAPDLKKS
jgi:hypothetical protein